MGSFADENVPEVESLIRRASAGDNDALAALFEPYRQRLRKMVQVRLDRRLQGRIDASDVLQEAYLDVARRLGEYERERKLPLFLWLRLITGQRLLHLHRQHLQTAMRDANREISIYRGAMPQATTACLAASLMGRWTSVSQHAMRAEIQVRLQETLNSMEPIDREILVLRHFEELSNGEAAQVLEISKTAASNRYIRALRRLKEALTGIQGLLNDDL
jgi:RNA polymerase sigma-70 factor (ECF subfamily)